MSRVRNRIARRTVSPRALMVTATLLGAAVVAVAPTAASEAAEPGRIETGKLTLENAKPLPVPPPPRLQTLQSVKAPPRFTAPQPIEPPPLPSIGELAPVPPPAPIAGAPPAQPNTQTAARPAEPPPRPAPSPRPAAPSPQAAPPQAPPTQTAALPPSPPPTAPQPRPTLSVVFDGAAADVPQAAAAGVAEMAEYMRANETARLQLRSYASGTPETAREARQLSLARALAVRERLTAMGIRSTRIDIRALGMATTEGPPDRIDAEFTN